MTYTKRHVSSDIKEFLLIFGVCALVACVAAGDWRFIP